jgi:hypothetical protein
MASAPLRSLLAVLAVASGFVSARPARADAGVAPVVVGAFQACSGASDCASGFCVEGVCCDGACTSPCHSCALPGSPGKCTAAPRGSDPRAECAAAGTCTGTCDGAGACTTSFDGATCGKARCAGNTGNAAPVCTGGTCGTAGAGFDCLPYACATPFGACSTQCSGDADCAPGLACNTTTKACGAPVAHCNADGVTAVDATGHGYDCTPYRCSGNGMCGQTCSADKDCVTGNTCDASTGKCGVATPAPASSGSGCATGAGGLGDAGGAAPWLALGALCALGGLVTRGARGRRARR